MLLKLLILFFFSYNKGMNSSVHEIWSLGDGLPTVATTVAEWTRNNFWSQDPSTFSFRPNFYYIPSYPNDMNGITFRVSIVMVSNVFNPNIF